MFIIYINDIGRELQNKLRLFADDAVVYRQVMSKSDEESLQKDLDKLWEWAVRNGMKFNVNKCQVVKYSNGKQEEEPSYEMGGNRLENMEKYKYLGVVLDKKLNWNDHVDAVTKKATRNMNFVMRSLEGATTEVKEKAYLTLIRPIAEYAGAVWDPHKVGQIRKIEGIQRWAARRVTGKLRRRKWVIQDRKREGINIRLIRVPESGTEMIKGLGWKSLKDRRREMRLCNFFKAYSGQVGWDDIGHRIGTPSYLGRKDHGEKVKIIESRRDVGKYSFIRRTICDWNRLDENKITPLPGDLYKFKIRLQTR